jgi:hypothetical protein
MAAKLHQNLEWTPEKLGVISSMWREYTVPEIAEALGEDCSLSAIYSKGQRMGLGKKPKAPKVRALRRANCLPRSERTPKYMTKPFKRVSPLDITEGHRAIDARSYELLKLAGVA